MSIDSSKGCFVFTDRSVDRTEEPNNRLTEERRARASAVRLKKSPEAAPPNIDDFGGFWSVNPRRRMKRVKQLFYAV